jgi:hypothetical protein
MASTTVALTHPEVVAPATITVSTFRLASQAARSVPANADGNRFRRTSSSGNGVSSGTTAESGLDSVSASSEGTLRENTFASLASSAKTTLVKAIGHFIDLASPRRPCVSAIAARMFPPPNAAASAKPLTKSTMTSAGRSPMPDGLPKP